MSRGLIRAYVMLLCVAAAGQQIFSGSGRYSGTATFSVVGSGPPTSYNARTDACVTGLETGCTGLGLSFQLRTTDTVPFTGFPATPATQNIAGGYTLLSTDPDFHGYELIASDWTVKNNYSSFNAESIGINADSTMLGITTTNAAAPFEYMNKTAINAAKAICGSSCQNVVCNGCITKSAINGAANPPVCSVNCTILNGSNVAWSFVPGEANVVYELSTSGLQIYKDTICRAGSSDAICSSTASDTFVRTLYLDFTSDTPKACGILPSSYTQGWSGQFKVGGDGSIYLTMSGGAEWQPNHAYTTDDFIFPQINNGATPTKGYQVTVAGTSGNTEPTWSTTCPSSGNSCSGDGTTNPVTWTNINGVVAQGTGFDFVGYSASFGCSRWNTRIGKVYRGTGVNTSVHAAGAVVTDDDTICGQYGVSYPGTCPLTDVLSIHDGGGEVNPAYAHFAPGGSPFGSGGSACTNGAAGTCSCTASNASYKGAYNSGSTYSSTTHDTVYDPTNTPHSLYVAKTSVPVSTPPPNATYWNPADASCYTYTWQVDSNIVRPCIWRGASGGGQCDGHPIHGYNKDYTGSGPSGPYSHLWARPSVGGAANPGIGIGPGVNTPWDSHGTVAVLDTNDVTPVGQAQTDVPGSNYTTEGVPGATQNLPYYDELVMFKQNYSSQPSTATIYRMTHEFNDGSAPAYAEQNNFAKVSADGLWALIGSNLMGTRGSRSADWSANKTYAVGQYVYPITTSQNTGYNEFMATVAGTSNSNTANEPNWDACATTCTDGTVTWTNTHKSCNNLRGLYNPIANQAFSTGDTIFPVSNNGNFNIFQATTGGTTGGTIPNWDSVAPGYGNTATDGTVVWTNMGPNTCRSDVFLLDMMSAH